MGWMWSTGLEFDMSVFKYLNPLGPFKFPNTPHLLLYLKPHTNHSTWMLCAHSSTRTSYKAEKPHA